MIRSKEDLVQKILDRFGSFATTVEFTQPSNISAPMFVQNSGSIIRKLSPGLGRISPTGGYFQACGVHLDVYLRTVERTWEDLASVANISVPYPNELGPHTFHKMFGFAANSLASWTKFDFSIAGIDRYFEQLDAAQITSRLKNVSEFEDPKYWDVLVNTEVELPEDPSVFGLNMKGFVFRRLVIAHMQTNPNFEAIIKYHRSFYDDYRMIESVKNLPDAVDTLITRLS